MGDRIGQRYFWIKTKSRQKVNHFSLTKKVLFASPFSARPKAPCVGRYDVCRGWSARIPECFPAAAYPPDRLHPADRHHRRAFWHSAPFAECSRAGCLAPPLREQHPGGLICSPAPIRVFPGGTQCNCKPPAQPIKLPDEARNPIQSPPPSKSKEARKV